MLDRVAIGLPYRERSAMNPLVVVIDDEPFVRQSIQALLESLMSVRVRTFGSGHEFLAQIPDDISCLVMDRRMPGLSGEQVLAELEKLSVSIPAILISGHADTETATSGLAANVIGEMPKPFRAAQLIALIEKALAAQSSKTPSEGSTMETAGSAAAANGVGRKSKSESKTAAGSTN